MEGVPIVVPVRWSCGPIAAQTTSGWLSLTAAFIRCVEPPGVNASIALQISLPGEDAPEQLEAVVGAASGRGAESGFWARFLGLRVASRKRINRFLKGRDAALTSLSRRAFPRIPLRRQVQVRAESTGAFNAYTQNISRAGLFISAPFPPALHEIVDLSLKLPDRLGPARTKAVVVQRVLPREVRGARAGAGLQFVEADDAFRERLDSCLENLLSVQLKTA